ncbi:MAG: prepilin-type N-terminal cleavage/methylation domain-containing protein [Phycisphaeraceae bacterium]|nr:prepilin-type N-terminal cleavage/methylation domain-containing protein [Phycisphaeraceae bacterium]
MIFDFRFSICEWRSERRPGASARRNRKSKIENQKSTIAFTLIELLLVLAVMSVAAAVAVPRYAGSVQRYRLDAASRHLAAQFDLAQRYARAHGKTVTLATDTTDNLVRFSDADGNIVSDTQLDESPFIAVLTSVKIANGTTLQFDGYGKPNTTAKLVIAVGDKQRAVTYDSTTEQMSVE